MPSLFCGKVLGRSSLALMERPWSVILPNWKCRLADCDTSYAYPRARFSLNSDRSKPSPHQNGDLGAVSDSQFAQDSGGMDLRCGLGDVEIAGDLLVRVTFGHKLEHLLLP